MFTEQHYEAIAEIIKQNTAEVELVILHKKYSSYYICWDDFVDDLVGYFAKDNPLFDEDKFERACELVED